MSKYTVTVLALAAGLFAAACSPKETHDPQADISSIVSLYDTWRTAVETGDIPLYLSVLDENVSLMPPGAADIVGRDTYGAFLGPVFEAATYRVEIRRPQEIEVMGDIAFVRYDYTVYLSLKNPEQGITQPGALTANVSTSKYFDVLRRQEDGSWKVYRHTWNHAPSG